MGKIETTWKRMCFKNNKVWLFSDLDGNPIVNNGKVRIKYQIEQDYEYWVHEKSIKPLSSFSYNRKTKQKGKTAKKHTKKVGQEEKILNKDNNKNVINLYTDGASSGNPGPSGIGVLLCFGNHEKELSRYIGHATNNVAELEAIKTGLMEIKNREIPVCVYTDSGYALGIQQRGIWHACPAGIIIGILDAGFAALAAADFKGGGH